MKARLALEMRQKYGRSAMACVMLTLWLGLMALVTSPLLHARLHSDSQSADHVCLVTQIQHQHLLAAAVPVTVPSAPLHVIPFFSPTETQFFFSSSDQLAPGRGPPASCLIGKVAG